MTIYDNLLETTKYYMGPAADRFLKRQLSGHLNISPDELNTQHLDDLAEWCLTSAKLIIDEDKAMELCQEIKSFK